MHAMQPKYYHHSKVCEFLRYLECGLDPALQLEVTLVRAQVFLPLVSATLGLAFYTVPELQAVTVSCVVVAVQKERARCTVYLFFILESFRLRLST